MMYTSNRIEFGRVLLKCPELVMALQKYLLLRQMNLNYESYLDILNRRHSFQGQDIEVHIENDIVTLTARYVHGIFKIESLKEESPICLMIPNSLSNSLNVDTMNITVTGTKFTIR